MATIKDYLEWRGDVPFSLSPFNEVDNYIVAKIGMLDFSGIVPENGETIPAGEAIRRWREANPEVERIGALGSKNVVPVMLQLAETARFAQLGLCFYTQRYRLQDNEQFSALTIRLPDGEHYVSFRGTDDYINAWREDCYLSFLDEVPAQSDAAAYLCYVARETESALIVGGHSKGGNLAVFAAACAPEEVQERISRVYTNDGPGFRDSFFETPGYLAIRDKIYSVVPQQCIVGELLDPVPVTTIAACDTGFGAAHDGFNWEVTPKGFVRRDSLIRSAKRINDALDMALAQKTDEERKVFIDEFFDILTADGHDTISELLEGNFRAAMNLVKDISEGAEAMGFLKLVLGEIIRENAENVKDSAARIPSKLYRRVRREKKHEAGGEN